MQSISREYHSRRFLLLKWRQKRQLGRPILSENLRSRSEFCATQIVWEHWLELLVLIFFINLDHKLFLVIVGDALTTPMTLSTEYRRQSSEGYPTKVDWSAVVRVIKNKKTTETQELDRFGPSARRNTLLLWSVGLYWLSYDIACDQICRLGDPCPPYIL